MKHIFLYLFFFSFFLPLQAQEKVDFDYQNQSLKEVLETLENHFGVKFSFNENVLNQKTFSFKGKSTFSELLNILQEQTKLYFEALDEKNILVLKKKPEDQGSSICGDISDVNGVLSDVVVGIKSKYRGTITNEEGHFELDNVRDDDIIEIQFLGYKTLTFKKTDFPDTDCIVVTLEEDTTMLSEVVLTEYITTGFDRNNHDGSVTITPKKLGILPGLTEPDVLQSLQLLPGVSSPSESASEIHIRGGTPDQNLVLWDNIKMYHQGHYFGQISAFNPYITDNVSIYRSGTSAKYGDRVSGVVDIQSPNKIDDQFSAGAGFNFTQADFYIKTPIVKNKLGLIFSSRRSYSDIINTITFEKLGNKVFQNTKIENGIATLDESFDEINNTFYFTDTNLKLNWQPSEKDRVSFSGLLVNNDLDYSVVTSIRNEQDELDLINNGFSLEWNREHSEKLSFNFKSYLSNYRSDFSFSERILDENEDEIALLSKNNTVDDFGASFHTTLKLNDHNTLLSGYDFVNNDVFYRITFTEDGELDVDLDENEKLISHSVFGEYDFHKNGFLLRAGLRANYFSSDESIRLEPRVYLEKNLTKTLKIKASGEIKNQVISQLVLFDFNDIGVGNNIWVLADNEEIPVLNSRQFSSGFLFQKNGWNLDIDGYYRKIRGLTSFSKGFNSNNSGPDDYAEGTNTIYGIDFLIKKRIGNFRTWLSYSLSKSEFSFPELQAEQFPGNFDQRHGLTFSNTLKVKNFQFSLGWHFFSGKPFSQPLRIDTVTDPNGNNTQTIVYGKQNTRNLSNYHKLDASVVYDFYLGKQNKFKARIGASVLNLYNRRNEIDKTFKLNTNSNDPDDPNAEIIEETRVGLGITPNIVFRLSF